MVPIKQQAFIDEAEKLLKKIQKTPTLCMFPECTCKAINSHVFQDKKILRPIGPTNHLYCFEPNNLFRKNQRYSYTSRGINHVLSFWGYCQPHDDKIFSLIEKTDNVDWFSPNAQFLLGYKTLCRELYVKRLAVKYYNSLLAKYSLPKEIMQRIESSVIGCEMGINDLNRYKVFLELAIFNSNYTYYSFETYTLPFYIELFVASPVSVSYSTEIPNKDIFEVDLPETNFVVIFPHKGMTYAIVGIAHGFENQWAHEFIRVLKTHDSSMINKSLSDLILFRTDFNCMSEDLFRSIPEDELNGFLKEYKQNVISKSFRLSTHINIFKHFK